jgi:AcrR family transcriptional regulator
MLAVVAAEEFARRGYAASTVRGIARTAGVDGRLVYYHFGSKEKLFDACTPWPVQTRRRVLALPHETGALGRALAELLLGPDADTRRVLTLLLRSAVVDGYATARLRDLLNIEVIDPLAAILPGDAGRQRAVAAVTCLIGFALARDVVELPPFDTLRVTDLVTAAAPAVGRALAGA